jgi:hypothetical protein
MGAFMPGLVLNGVSFGAGLMQRVGFPGTQPVPIDGDNMRPSPLGYEPKTLESNNAPDEILPTLYVAGTANMGPFAGRGAASVKMSDNPLPVPAGTFGVVPLEVFRAAKIGGRKVIGWPRANITWPSVNSGSA